MIYDMCLEGTQLTQQEDEMRVGKN
jgi:hypothetical protein